MPSSGLAARLALFAGALTLWSPRPTYAYAGAHSGWSNGNFSYAVNEDSFNSRLNGLSVTDEQAQFWTRWALAQWRERAGLDLGLTELGDTNFGDNQDDCFEAKSKNFVAVHPGCHPDYGCVATGSTNTWLSGSTPTRTSICLFGQSGPWNIDTDNLALEEIDMPSTLVHELGHALGLNHQGFTSMQGFQWTGFTWMRYQYGDDLEGMRSRPNYDTISTALVAHKVVGNTVVFPPVSVSSSVAWGAVGAAIGTNSGTTWVIRAAPSTSSNYVHFTRATYPISSSSSWTNRSIGWTGGTWISPAIVYGEGKFVAAWPNKQHDWNSDDCSGIRIVSTTNAFDTVTEVNLPTDCSRHAVTLGYDNGRFVLAWINDEISQSNQDKIYYRVSPDGVTWNSRKSLGIRSHAGPSIACSTATSNCVFAYSHRSGSDTVTRSLDVNTTTVTVSSNYSSTQFFTLFGPNVGSQSDAANTFLLTQTNLNKALILELDNAAPITPWNDNLVLISPSFNRGGITANSAYSTAYVFYTL